MPTDAEYIEAFEARLHRDEIATLLSVSLHAAKEARKRIIAEGLWTPPADMAASDWSGGKKATPPRDVLIAAFKSGKPMPEIERELGLSNTATYVARKKLEAEGVLTKADRHGGRKLPSDAVMATAFKAGRPVAELAQEWGAKKSTVYNARTRLKEAGMLNVEKKKPVAVHFERKMPEENIVIDALASGRSPDDLALEWGVSPATIDHTRRTLFRVGSTGKRLKRGRVKPRVLRRLFETLSVSQVAKVLGITPAAAYAARKKLAIGAPVEEVNTISTPPAHEMAAKPFDMIGKYRDFVEAANGAYGRVKARTADMLVQGCSISEIAEQIGADVEDVYATRDELLADGTIRVDVRQHDLSEISAEFFDFDSARLGKLIDRLAAAGLVKDLRDRRTNERGGSIYVRIGHPKGAHRKEF